MVGWMRAHAKYVETKINNTLRVSLVSLVKLKNKNARSQRIKILLVGDMPLVLKWCQLPSNLKRIHIANLVVFSPRLNTYYYPDSTLSLYCCPPTNARASAQASPHQIAPFRASKPSNIVSRSDFVNENDPVSPIASGSPPNLALMSRSPIS